MLLYTRNNSPKFYFRPFHARCQWANSKQFVISNLFKNSVYFRIWANSIQAKTICKCRKAKTRGEKKFLYRICLQASVKQMWNRQNWYPTNIVETTVLVFYNFKSLRGQSCELQAWFIESEPTQSAPNPSRVGLLQALVLVCTPPPQDLEQLPHAPQRESPPFRSKENTVSIPYIFALNDKEKINPVYTYKSLVCLHSMSMTKKTYRPKFSLT